MAQLLKDGSNLRGSEYNYLSFPEDSVQDGRSSPSRRLIASGLAGMFGMYSPVAGFTGAVRGSCGDLAWLF